jgi:hypothetical protein
VAYRQTHLDVVGNVAFPAEAEPAAGNSATLIALDAAVVVQIADYQPSA